MRSTEFGIGLVGYGLGGKVFHAPLIASVPRLQLRGVVTSRVAEVEADLPGVPALPDLDALLGDASVELIVVTTPSPTHHAVAERALLANRHVVIDKPMALSTAEADDLIATARAQNRTVVPYHNRRWDGDFQTLRQLVAEGRLGDVVHFESHFDRFRAAIKPGWREEPQPGSGVLYDLGPHLIDQALVLFGMPHAVTADVLAQRDNARADDYFHLVLDYDRRRAVLHAATLVREPGARFAVHGAQGSFVKYGLDPQEEALKAGGRPGGSEWGMEPPERYGTLTHADGTRERVATLPGSYQAFYEGVLAHLRDGAPPPVRAEAGRDTLAVIEAARRSAAERRTVALNTPSNSPA